MKKLIVFCTVLVLILSGCTFSFEVITPPDPGATDVQLTPYSTRVAPTIVATISATTVPIPSTLAAPSTAPIFFNGRAAATPDDVSKTMEFGPGTKRVYVIWDYQNMKAGMMVRREWYLNGQPWLTREEPWDFAKYGGTGTMRDVSIYDEVAGLSHGNYSFRIFIDNVVQPLGSMINEPINEWVGFSVGSNEQETFMGYGSFDGQWGVEVYDGNRIMLKNIATGESRLINIVQEVAYVNWFNDNRHFLFVDRDRSEQRAGSTLGIRDHLWIVDVPSGDARRVYRGDAAFSGTLGPAPSPDGRYIAGVEGSGYADACFMDKRLIFFDVASNFSSVQPVKQAEFSGLPVLSGGVFFPVEAGYWENESSYFVVLSAACNPSQNDVGNFHFNLQNRTVFHESPSTGQTVPGDLGLGSVHGKVTDTTGAPIPNATVTCEHSSYRPATPCTGIVWTAADGSFAFTNVFFHDTDTIKIRVQAPGYEYQELTATAFTISDWEVNVMLNRTP